MGHKTHCISQPLTPGLQDRRMQILTGDGALLYVLKSHCVYLKAI